MEEKNISFFRFEDLRVYGKAIDYGKWVIVNLKQPQTENEKRLAAAFIHAAISIAQNIAEGSSHTKSQFEYYLKNAKSAIRECIVFTELATGVDLLGEEAREQSREYLMELTRMLGALIISLQKVGRQCDNGDDDYGTDNDGVYE